MLKPARAPSPSPEFKSPLPSGERGSTVLAGDHPDAGAGAEFLNGGYYQGATGECSFEDGGFLGRAFSPPPPAATTTTAVWVTPGSSSSSSAASSSSSSSSGSESELSESRCSSYCIRSLFFLSASATVGMALLYTFRDNPISATGFWLFATGLFVATFTAVEESERAKNASTALLRRTKSTSNCRKAVAYSVATLSLGSAVVACYFSVKHEPSVASALWGVVIVAAVLAQRAFDYQSVTTVSPGLGYGTIN